MYDLATQSQDITGRKYSHKIYSASSTFLGLKSNAGAWHGQLLCNYIGLGATRLSWPFAVGDRTFKCTDPSHFSCMCTVYSFQPLFLSL